MRNPPAEASSLLDTGIRFSICTLVTRPEQYADMLASFHKQGFDADDCEFIQIDNRETNRYDAYQGCNLFLTVARGKYVILCHQDILLIDHRDVLERALADLDRLDPSWGACGNSGGMAPGKMAIRLTDPHATDLRTTTFPARVYSLDENFILAKRSANLSLSRDLAGFHQYGCDICIVADVLGYTTYVVDFHLRHLSPGTREPALGAARANLVRKYLRAFRSRWIMSPCELFLLSGSSLLSMLFTNEFAIRVHRRLSGVSKARWLGPQSGRRFI
jgi:hypothetical protein